MSKVFVGIGHGGSDPGACAYSLKESDVALDIGLEVARVLRAHNVTVELSRTKDIDDDLTPKINRCNDFNPDLAVDIHCNAGNGKGFEAWVFSGGGTSLTMGENIETEVLKVGQTSRGMKTRLNDKGQDYFGFIRLVKAPSAIIETAFIDNVDDKEWLRTKERRHILALAIAKGLLNTLGIKYQENSSEGQEIAVKAIYKKYEDISAYAKPTIKKLIDKGVLKGDDSGDLNLTDEMIRIFVVHDRLGLYD